MKYQLIEEYSVGSLSARINTLLQEGWTPLGPAQVFERTTVNNQYTPQLVNGQYYNIQANVTSYTTYYYQTMIKKESAQLELGF